MKRVLCPKCENYLYFDETKYEEGQSLVFVCEHCGKQFSIRLGKSKVKALVPIKYNLLVHQLSLLHLLKFLLLYYYFFVLMGEIQK